jgi:uncharacterized repeat protein (TIGR01451 family)/CSLREA domain-containing protein
MGSAALSDSDLSIQAGTDYTPVSGTLIFSPGQISQTFTVPIIDDTLAEGNETVSLNLNTPVNASLIAPATATLTIVDNDGPPALTINDVIVTEGNIPGAVDAIFTVTLSASSGQTVTVNYATADGTATAGADYNSAGGSLTFAPGVMSQSITVTVLGDTLAEANETFLVNLTGETNAILLDNQGLGTITDDDGAVILAITKSANPSVVLPGDAITYTLVVTNSGSITATSALISDNLPANTTFISGTISLNPAGAGTAGSAPPILASGLTIAPGQQIAVTFVVTVSNSLIPSTILTNTAAVTSAEVITPLTAIAVTTVQDLYDLSGRVFEDTNYNGGAGTAFGSGDAGLPGVLVDLYTGGGAFVASTSTNATGIYTFTGLMASNYLVRVNSASLGDADTPPVAGFNSGFSSATAEQTYESNGVSGNGGAGALGGNSPTIADPGAAPLGDTNVAVVVSSADVSGVDFGFAYNLIVNTNDSGQGSLRQFMLNANAIAGGQASQFNIPSSSDPFGRPADPNFSGGVASISPLTVLPGLTDANTILDGTTQTGNVGDTNSGQLGAGGTVGVDGLTLSLVNRPEVQLVGAGSRPVGLDLQANRLTVRGMAIYGFGNSPDSNNSANIRIADAVTNTLIEQNIIGAAATTFSDPGAGRSQGDNIRSVGGDGGVIRNNLIGFSAGNGIALRNTSLNWLIQNNEISGNAIGNAGLDGIPLEEASGATLITGNLINATEGIGIELYASSGSNQIQSNTISGNGLGLDSGVETAGLRLDGPDNLISRNIINANYGAGILVLSSARANTISQNAIFDNGTITTGFGGPSGQIGIDLLDGAEDINQGTPPFVTLNDNGDGDTGGNDLLNYPVIYDVSMAGGNITITGEASANATVEFFAADNDPSGYGEGQRLIGAGVVTGITPGVVDATARQFSFTFAAGAFGVADLVTATATDPAGNTSEFSPNTGVPQRTISGLVFEDTNYAGGAGTALGPGDTGLPNVLLGLYSSTGGLVASTTTTAGGYYTFTVSSAGPFTIRAMSSSIGDGDTPPAAGFNAGFTPLVAEQTYESDGVSGNGGTGALGGNSPTVSDFTLPISDIGDTNVTVNVPTDLTGVDFGFVYNLVVNTRDNDQGSLRQAMLNANAISGSADILFNIPGSFPFIIRPNSALPIITDTVRIDGWSQPGWSNTPLIELNGNNAGAVVSGLQIELGGSGSTIRGLVINRFSNFGINLPSADNVIIQGNYIGTNFNGSGAQANNMGIFATAAFSLTIGGPNPYERNLVSGNAVHGIVLTSIDNSVIQGNYIGVNAAGTGSIPNGTHGLLLELSNNNLIGGAATGERNLISGNGANGIAIVNGADNNQLQGNYIGTNVTGAAAIPNASNGIRILDSVGTSIGGPTPGARNLISGNLSRGITILGTSSDTTILGNYIGVDVNGTAVLGNGSHGIQVDAVNTTIGGTAPGAANIIAANSGRGINLVSGTGHAIRANSLYQNSSIGIDLNNDLITNNDGNLNPGLPNNGMDYPVLTTAVLSGTNLTVSGYVGNGPGGNASFAGARVDLFISDESDPYGEGQTYLGTVNVNGSGSFNSTLTVSGLIEGNRLTATATDIGPGNTSEFGPNFLLTNNNVVVNEVGDAPDADLTDGVCQTSTPNRCTLRAAIQQANSNPGPNNILFDIIGGCSGVCTISPLSALPTITDTVTVDGWSQIGWINAPIIEINGVGAGAGVSGLTITTTNSTIRGLIINRFNANGMLISTNSGNNVQGCYIGPNATGTTALGNGGAGILITNNADNTTIGGSTPIQRNVIAGNLGGGIRLDGLDTERAAIQGNTIGLNAAGDGILANTGDGITITGTGGVHTIGGQNSGQGNLISGNTGNGISINGFGVTGMIIRGNIIGLDANGTIPLANGGNGIYAQGPLNTIGGSTASAANLISGNGQAGIQLAGDGNFVADNLIGTDLSSANPVPNSGPGIQLTNLAANNTISSSTTGLIAFNSGDGIELTTTGNGNRIWGYQISGNGGLGIDFNGDGVTTNNGLVGSGPNNGMDYPIFSSATISGTTLTVAGYIGAAPDDPDFANARVDLYVSDSDPSGFGEGQSYLGFLTADANGNFSGSLTVSGVSPGQLISATATDTGNNTSEFGLNYLLTAPLVVNVTGDAPDADTADGLCQTTTVGECSLRAAIEQANAIIGTNTILFNIPGAGPHTIAPSSALPEVDGPVFMDGWSEPDFSSTPIIELDGTGAGLTTAGLRFGPNSDGSTLRGLVINRFSGDGIVVLAGANGLVIGGNYIGTDVGGNLDQGNGGNGLWLESANNLIGGATPANRNLISGNGNGILLTGSTATGNLLVGNYIGVNVTGTGAVGNANAGVRLENDADNNTVGGTSSGARNVISGNTDGIIITGANTTGAIVQGNYIGTNAIGDAIIGNSTDGIYLSNATNSLIGGATTGAGNLISGNNSGISVSGSGSNMAVTIQGNLIGTNAAGTGALGNLDTGIRLIASNANTIGGTSPEARNIISANGGSGSNDMGLLLQNSNNNLIQGNYIGADRSGNSALGNVGAGIYLGSGSTGNTIGGSSASAQNIIVSNQVGISINAATNNLIQGNSIGVGADGVTGLGNTQQGIYLLNGAQNNTIGGTVTGAGNVIVNNGEGVTVISNSSTGNAIWGNSVYSNTTLGIDLADDGVTLNNGALDTGPNRGMDFPVFSSAVISGTRLIFAGYVGPTPNDTEFVNARIEIFISDNDAGGYGEGQRYLGFVIADINGNFNGSLTVSSVIVGERLTATATNPNGNTSEYGPNFLLTDALVVNSTGDGPDANLGDTTCQTTILGECTLRAAIQQANTITGANTILFNIPGGGPTYTIAPNSELPQITDPVFIDAWSQPGFVSAPIVEINGAATVGVNGLTVTSAASGSAIRGFVVNRFDGAGIYLPSAGYTVIQGNYIGLNLAGALARPNGIGILATAAPGLTIGGPNANEGNIISGNTNDGLTLAEIDDSLIQRNIIGLNPGGTIARPNGNNGISLLSGSTNNVIGGLITSTRNIVSGNGIFGIELADSGTSGNIIQGNYIGPNNLGTAGLGNGASGISISAGAVGNTIGGTTATARNLISDNIGFGVAITGSGSDGNIIQGNYIGVDVTGLVGLGNNSGGVSISGGAANNLVSDGNRIANNTSDGVVLLNASTGNRIWGNEIFANGDLGIDLTNNGVTPNDGATTTGQPNRLMDFPIFTSAAISNTMLTVSGYIGAAPGDTDFANSRVEIFLSDSDLSGNGEGQTYVGVLTTTTSGSFSGNLTVSGVNSGNLLTATATDSNGNTSEFGPNYAVVALLVVNTTGDAPDANLADGNCETALVGECSLRAAIQQANASAGANTIWFNIPGAGPHTITPASALPAITGTVTIDGWSEPDYLSTPVILLDGNNVTGDGLVLASTADGSLIRGLIIRHFVGDGIEIRSGSNNHTIVGNFLGRFTTTGGDAGAAEANTGYGLQVLGSGNVIGGTTTGERNLVGGNGIDGIAILGAGASNNLVRGNYIGTDVAGAISIANTEDGVWINGASNNTIGGAVTGAGNLISGNNWSGIALAGGSSSNLIQGNFVGADATGSSAISNGFDGIQITNSPANTIGGTATGAGNVISGNLGRGILLNSSSGIVIQGNYVGTDPTGTAAIANGQEGIYATSASNNTIGGMALAARNVIAGNGNDGIFIGDPASADNVIQGNYIGVIAAGNATLGNQSEGITLSGAVNTQIGGPGTGAGNVIGGSTYEGIWLINGATGTVIQGNYIGTDATGTLNLGNNDSGIGIGNTGIASSNNLVTGNVVAFNNRVGVAIDQSGPSQPSVGNAVLGNAIYSNIGLGIDLDDSFASPSSPGVTPNDGPGDADTGGNNRQNYPVLTLAATIGSQITISGTLTSTTSTAFRIEFFANTSADPSGYGEGQRYLGVYTATTSAGGVVSFTTTLTATVATTETVSATATDPSGNTSEFSTVIAPTS